MVAKPPPDLLEGRVVAAVDGSEHARHAVQWAARHAALEHRRLVVLAAGPRARGAIPDAVAAAREARAGLAVTGCPVDGDPRAVLLDASRHAFVLVMGSRGRGALPSALLGSVSVAVARHASCPVVVCRPHRDPRSGVVVGADGSPASLPVVEFAYRQAYLRELPLTVLHTFLDPAAAVAQYHRDRGEAYAGLALDELRDGLAASVSGLDRDYPDVAVTLSVEHGLAEEALTPRDGRWELIVVGRHRVTTLQRLLTGSVSMAVLERARATVAVVPTFS